MSRNLPQAQLAELPKPTQTAFIELFELDLTALGGTTHKLCNQVNEKQEPVVWQGITYAPYPIQSDGFELNTTGASNRPSLSVSNLFGLVTGLIESDKGVVGAKVVRRQVYAKHLDAINFVDGNPHADPTAEAVSFYVIESYKSLNSTSATFELAVPAEADGVMIPRRIIISNTSPSAYKQSTGVLAYREND